MADETFRSPGQPRMPELPGGLPTASQPAPFPNPPGINAAPAGRPPKPSPASAGGAALPISRPQTAPTSAPPPRPPMPAGPPRPSMPSAGPQIQPGTAPRPGAAPAAPAGPAPMAPSFQLDRIPTTAEMAQLPPGTTVMTPYGTVDALGKLTPTPETEQRYREATVQRRKAFGPHPFSGIPGAPEPPVRLGKPGFNPFTGQWLS